jgi:RNA ligase (TIGR02306 family)
MRKLATIQRVHSIEPIDGADSIVKIGVLGWTLVSKKGNFETDDLCVYFEADSQLPNTEEFDFMLKGMSEEDKENPNKVKRALRVRTKKIRNVVSHGLALPVKCFIHKIPKPFNEGDDVTEALGVTKYDPPEETMPKEADCTFPFQIPKTDEIRIQAVPRLLNELRGAACYSTVKMDGQSLTFARLVESDGSISNKVCTRNFALKPIEGSPHWKMANKLEIFNKLPANFAIQGEFCGPGVQGNKLSLKEHQFFAFQLWDVTNQKYIPFKEFKAKCDEWGISTVPVESEYFIMDHTVNQLIEMSVGKYASGHPREGLVIRTIDERISKTLEDYGDPRRARASFKVINPEFLLKVKG